VAFLFGWEQLNLMRVEVVVTLMAVCGTGTFWVELSAVLHTVMQCISDLSYGYSLVCH